MAQNHGTKNKGVLAPENQVAGGLSDPDSELAAAIATINSSLPSKQDVSTAATDAELASAVATINTALSSKASSTLLGTANGIATLGADGKVPTLQLPAETDSAALAALTTHAASTTAHNLTAQLAAKASTAALKAIAWPGRIVATQSAQMGGNAGGTLSTGTGALGMMTRKRHRTGGDVGNVRLVYENSYNGVSGAANHVAITVRASLEPGNGVTPIPVYFNGVRDAVIPVGGKAISDPLPLDLAAQTIFYSWTSVLVASAGNKWPLYTYMNEVANWGEGADYTIADNTLNLSYPSTWSFGYYPYMIVSDEALAATIPCVGLYGDSIMQGSDSGSLSYVIQALNDTVPFINVAKSGESVSTWAARNQQTIRKSYLRNITCAVTNYGINDLNSGRTTAQIANDNLTFATLLYRRGVPVYVCTLSPYTTSSDSWATTANQTVSANESRRTVYNDWLRAGAPIDPTTKVYVATGTVGALLAGQSGHPFTGVFEVADALETARNSGKWKSVGTGAASAYTVDGLHPKDIGHVAAKAAISVPLLSAVS